MNKIDFDTFRDSIQGVAASSMKAIVPAVVALLLLAAPVFAQQSADERSGQSQQARMQPAPEGWVWIGYDSNNDGVIDSYEYILAYDLEQAREHSQQRMQQSGLSSNQQFQSPQWQRQQTQHMQSQNQVIRLQGQIQSMRTMPLTRIDEKHVLAKVQTQDGWIARVDLGPKWQVDKLNLSRGDQVTMLGNSGTIDDVAVFIADRIHSNGQTRNISRMNDQELKKFNVKVLNTRTASFSGKNLPDQLFARVRMDNGQTTVVNLGPADELANLNIQPEDNIAVLAHPADINGKLALVADEVFANGKLADIDRSGTSSSQQQTAG